MEVLDIKAARTEYAVADVIKNRWSPRSFSPKEIEKKYFAAILEAASWAPSAMNEQPWGYVAAMKQNEEGFDKLLKLVVPGNALWAKNAAALVLSYAKLTYANGAENVSALHDTGMANQNLLTQALTLDIYGHVMGGFDKKKAAEEFGLTEDYAPVCIIALGYPDDPEKLEEPFRTRETAARTRKSLDNFVAWI